MFEDPINCCEMISEENNTSSTCIYGHLSPINSAGSFVMEDRSDNISLPTGTKGRIPKKRCRRTFNEGPSEISQQPKPRQKEMSIDVLIYEKQKTLVEVMKVFKDRVSRRESIDKVEGMQNCINMIFPAMRYQKWPVSRDLQIIKNDMKVIEDDIKRLQNDGKSKEEITAELKPKLEKLHEAIQISDEERRRGIRVSHLFLPRETAISVLTADHEGQGSHQTPTSEKGHTDLLELEKKLFSIVKKVKFSHFDGLEEALLETVRGDIPKYLKDIARKIQAACGITETRNVHHNILMLVYAAVYEMEQCKGVELLNWDRLSKWVATCNQAKDAGFQVKFVEEHLKKILYAFHGFGLKMSGGDPKKRVWELEVELEMMRECLSAEESFKGKPLSHGLFSQ